MSATSETPACPVCLSPSGPRFLLEADAKNYYACTVCACRFLDPCGRPDPQIERAHYLTHENDPADPRYRAFLSKLADPLCERLHASASGLDYGCGPGPALACMLREAGHRVAVYDPFFAPNRDALEATYDFIVCTETAEHFHNPSGEFDRFDRMLKAGGWLAVMTCFQTDDNRFAGWHYRKDPTHVVFYRATTFRWLADKYGWRCEIPAKDIALLQKSSAGIDQAARAASHRPETG